MPVVVSYTNVSLMLAVIPALVSHSNLTSAQIAIFASGAEQEMVSILGKRYVMPPSSQNNVLEMIATDLACERILKQRILLMQPRNDSEWPDSFAKTRELLEDIASGKVALLDNSGNPIPARTTEIKIWSDKSGYEPTMTEDSPVNQVDDPNKIDDLRADREFD